MQDNQDQEPTRAVLAAVQLPDVDDGELAISLAELRRLGKTLGHEILGAVTQRRDHFEPAAYLGSGKVTELKLLVESSGADTVLVDHEISPSQARNLEKQTGAVVMDRTAVILEIFHRHARSRTAKAQVEIVRLQYMAPRLREQGKLRDRQRGGTGAKIRGAGEAQLELDRRRLRDRIAELSTELELLAREGQTQRERRQHVARVALVGYTNAGKSTLMRALTGSDVYVADKLFATLDSTVRVLVPETRPRILVSDTVGFIKNLPHELVASFKSTLDEALEASLLVEVVDASDPGFERQIEVTAEVLEEIGAGDIPRLVVMNKADRLPDERAATEDLRLRWPEALVISAKRETDVARLHAAIFERFARQLIEAELRVPWEGQKLRGEIFDTCQVLEERAAEDAALFRVRAHPETIARLVRRGAGHVA